MMSPEAKNRLFKLLMAVSAIDTAIAYSTKEPDVSLKLIEAREMLHQHIHILRGTA